MRDASVRRTRLRLLLLLWVWAICMFGVVDLFLNVPSFDRVRPRSSLYRGMRVAAHEMVGEPVRDGDARPRMSPGARGSTTLEVAYPNGMQMSEITFERGPQGELIRNGRCLFWYEDGSPWMEGEYLDNLPHGSWIVWRRGRVRWAHLEYAQGRRLDERCTVWDAAGRPGALAARSPFPVEIK